MTGSSDIQSVSFETYERIAGKARVCAGLRAHVDPEKATKPRFAAEFGKSYPVAHFGRSILAPADERPSFPTANFWRCSQQRIRTRADAHGMAPPYVAFALGHACGRSCPMDEQRAQITIAALADAEQHRALAAGVVAL